MMQLESKDLASTLPVLPRLDRLDFLLQVLEEKHGLSAVAKLVINNRVVKKEEEDGEHCRTVSLSSALQEVHHKGTLLDRLTALENRVVKLSLEMEEGNTSRSSSSKSRNGSVTRNDNEDEKVNLKERQLQEEATTTEVTSLSTENTDKEVVDNAKMRRKSYRKWGLGWLRLGCN
ncbi:hypothetical protein P3S67_023162 [Capsicum chacoense]|uniref:uncharacterized protein LOC107858868 n=1 Tax=Capsicum annuum TaxID=4072 RepID=UPI0007BF003E|nr:uncharacterized protein LOC107858868 [Capsicum annuum]